MFGAGAMTNSIDEIRDAQLLFVIGSNTTEAHPIIAMEMKRAVRRGARLMVADPRRRDQRWGGEVRGALRMADVATIDSRNAGRRAIAGSGAERIKAAVAVTAVDDGRRPMTTSPHVRAAVIAARHALGDPPANRACNKVSGMPMAAARRRASKPIAEPRTSQ